MPSLETPTEKKAKLTSSETPMSKAIVLSSGPREPSTSKPKVLPTFAKRSISEPLVIPEEFWTSLSEEMNAIMERKSRSFIACWSCKGGTGCSLSRSKSVRMWCGCSTKSMSFVPAKEEFKINDALLNWQGQLLPLSANVIAGALGLVTGEGYGIIHRKNWPTGAGEPSKKEIVETIYDGQSYTKLTTKNLRLDKKLLHSFLIKNVIPRQEKRSSVLIGDVVLMFKFITGVPIDLPQIILAHMQHCKSHATHALPYPHIIKQLLLSLHAYPAGYPEHRFANVLTMKNVRSLKFKSTIDEAAVEEEEPGQVPSARPSASSLLASADLQRLLSEISELRSAVMDGSSLIASAIAANGKAHMEKLDELAKRCCCMAETPTRTKSYRSSHQRNEPCFYDCSVVPISVPPVESFVF